MEADSPSTSHINENIVRTNISNGSSQEHKEVLRQVQHYRRPPCSFEINDDHRDSLSLFTFRSKNIHLRGLERFVSLIFFCGFIEKYFFQLPFVNLDNSKSFRILSYNILSQRKIQDDISLYTFLEWKFRWNLLSAELKSINADIICLQDLEKEKVLDFYEPLMDKDKKFKSFYAWKENGNGCGIFWNPNIFSNVEEIVVPLNEKSVAQIIRLKHSKTLKELIIVNSHLQYEPYRGDEKLSHLVLILANIYKVML